MIWAQLRIELKVKKTKGFENGLTFRYLRQTITIVSIDLKLLFSLTLFILVVQYNLFAQNINVESEYLFTVGEQTDFGEPGYLYMPQSVATDSKGRIFVSDHRGRTIHMYTPEGAYLKSFGRPGRGPGEFNRLTEIAIDEKDRLWVLDRFQFKAARFNTDNGDIVEHRFEDTPQINLMTLVPIGENHFAATYVEGGRNVNTSTETKAVRIYEFGTGEKLYSLFEIFNFQFDPEIAIHRSFGTGVGHKLELYSNHELVAGHTVYTGRHFIIDTDTDSLRIFKNEQITPPHYHLMDPNNRTTDVDQRFAGTVMSSGSMGQFYYQILHRSMLLGVVGGNLYHVYRHNELEGYKYTDYLEVYSPDGRLIFHDKLPELMKQKDEVRYRSYLHLDEDGRIFVRDTFEMDDPRLTVYRVTHN